MQLSFEKYISSMEAGKDFEPTGVKKDYYLDVIQYALNGYPDDKMRGMEPAGDIQTYSRIVSCLAILLSAGRCTQKYDLWEEMMTAACESIDYTKKILAFDFSVKELMVSYSLMHKKVPVQIEMQWKKQLSKILPSEYYVHTSGADHNINIYNLAGEWLRDIHGFTDSTGYFARCWPEQLKKFDANGMYPDNYNKTRFKNPILYDLTTRVQMQLIMGNGYDGVFLNDFDKVMQRGGLASLFSMSAAFELPYGGRSNQYLFNEALLAANFEYEAVRYKKLGDNKTAGAFKRAAHLAIKSISRWLEKGKHIKNFYNNELIGTESYGYYDKYMITLGSFIAIGYMFADDSIEEFVCPAEAGGYVFETSSYFNKIFANCGGYSLEFDTNADMSYDCSGLGRIHKRGVPTELGLSLPFTDNPAYKLPDWAERQCISIDAGWKTDQGIQYLSSQNELHHVVDVIRMDEEEVEFTVTYGENASVMPILTERYFINTCGVEIHAELMDSDSERVFFRVPLLVSNGDLPNAEATQIELEHGCVQVSMGDYTYTIETDGETGISEDSYNNRNGEYRVAHIIKDGNKLRISFKLV